MNESDKDINEILDMPFSFFMDVMNEKNKPQKEKSLISAFGG
ncbi:phage tail assembly chaperone GT [Staphylococcus equorum]